MKYLIALLLLSPVQNDVHRESRYISYIANSRYSEHQLYSTERVAPYRGRVQFVPTHDSKQTDEKVEVEDLILKLAAEYGVDPNVALRIAWCESKFDPLAKNPNSSASGVYQFIRGTWEAYGEGDVFNAEDNIRAFMRLYPRHPSWWECR